MITEMIPRAFFLFTTPSHRRSGVTLSSPTGSIYYYVINLLLYYYLIIFFYCESGGEDSRTMTETTPSALSYVLRLPTTYSQHVSFFIRFDGGDCIVGTRCNRA